MRLLLAVMAVLITGCATHNPEQRFLTAAAGDIVSTRIAIGTAGASEANVLGEPGAALAKIAFYAWTKTLPDEEQGYWHEMATPVLYGATANNVAIALGATNPVSLSIGLLTWLFTAGQ